MTKYFIFTIKVELEDMVQINNEEGGEATKDDYNFSNARNDMGGFLDGSSVSMILTNVETKSEEE